jgi:hypothetical protein
MFYKLLKQLFGFGQSYYEKVFLDANKSFQPPISTPVIAD